MYNTYVIVPSDSHIEDMDGLEGGVFAFTDPISYSGKLAVSFYLSDRMTSSENSSGGSIIRIVTISPSGPWLTISPMVHP